MPCVGQLIESIQKMGRGDILWLVLVYCITSLVIILWKRWHSSQRFPPGPFAWPLIGHLHHLQTLPHRKFRDLSKEYGPILGLKLGQRRAVVVGSRELAKEVLVTHDKAFANRPPHDFVKVMLYGPTNDVIFGPNGPQWRKQRKLGFLSLFTAKRLQELEHVRQEEIASLLFSLRRAASSASPIDLGNTVAEMASNVLMRLLVSKPAILIGQESARDFIKKLEHEGSFPTFGDLIPSLAFLDIPRKRHMRRLHDCADKTLSALIAERKKSTAAHDDFLQALLSKEAGHDPAVPPQETFTLDEIKGVILDTLAAGIHTTTLTLEWMMTELLRHPHCFQRLRQELDSTVQVGKEQQITDADLPKLSYLKLVAKEVFRLHPALPLLLPRISDSECVVGGYTLPANTYMFVNAWAIHRDETLWENAHEFRPERFEGKAADVDVRGQNFELLPFGSGRRVCLGMPMALPSVEGTLANLIHSFDWELPDGKPVTSISVAEHNGLAASRDTPLVLIPKPRKY